MVGNAGTQIVVAAQCRAARALLGITQVELASLAGLSKDVIVRMEMGRRDLHRDTVHHISVALAQNGLAFMHDDMSAGVNLRRNAVEITYEEVLTPVQCRAARALLEMSRARLASLVRVDKAKIADYELGRGNLDQARLRRVRANLGVHGVIFVNEPRFVGVKLRGLPRELERPRDF